MRERETEAENSGGSVSRCSEQREASFCDYSLVSTLNVSRCSQQTRPRRRLGLRRHLAGHL